MEQNKTKTIDAELYEQLLSTTVNLTWMVANLMNSGALNYVTKEDKEVVKSAIKQFQEFRNLAGSELGVQIRENEEIALLVKD